LDGHPAKTEAARKRLAIRLVTNFINNFG